jgi:Spy/CpxP family protein refolding chaperone
MQFICDGKTLELLQAARSIQCSAEIHSRAGGQMKRFLLLSISIILSFSAVAFAQRRQTLPCSAGAFCQSNNAAGNGANNTASNSNPGKDDVDGSDTTDQSIWKTANQLKLSSEQRAQVKAALKLQNEDSAADERALEDARGALAHALENGQTSFDAEIENLASAEGKVQESQLRRWEALYSVLTPDQQKQMLSIPTPLSSAAASPRLPQAQ